MDGRASVFGDSPGGTGVLHFTLEFSPCLSLPGLLGYPRVASPVRAAFWMPGSSPGMTREDGLASMANEGVE